MKNGAGKKWDPKDNRTRKVFQTHCTCDEPKVHSAVHFGDFCLECWHFVKPKVSQKRKSKKLPARKK